MLSFVCILCTVMFIREIGKSIRLEFICVCVCCCIYNVCICMKKDLSCVIKHNWWCISIFLVFSFVLPFATRTKFKLRSSMQYERNYPFSFSSSSLGSHSTMHERVKRKKKKQEKRSNVLALTLLRSIITITVKKE